MDSDDILQQTLDDPTEKYHDSDDGSSEAAIDLSDDEILKFLEVAFRNVSNLVKDVLTDRPDSCRVQKLVKSIEWFFLYYDDNNCKREIRNLLKVLGKYFI
jgi:hypothetical protein